jgi:hypothetical protein
MGSARDVCCLSASARLFYCLGNDQTLWRDMCLKHFDITTNKQFVAFGKDWIWLYKSKVELLSSNGVGMKKIQNRGLLQGQWADDQLEGYHLPHATALRYSLAFWTTGADPNVRTQIWSTDRG